MIWRRFSGVRSGEHIVVETWVIERVEGYLGVYLVYFTVESLRSEFARNFGFSLIQKSSLCLQTLDDDLTSLPKVAWHCYLNAS